MFWFTNTGQILSVKIIIFENPIPKLHRNIHGEFLNIHPLAMF